MATIPVFGMTIPSQLAVVPDHRGVAYFLCSAHGHVKFTALAGAVFAFCYNHCVALFGKRAP